jgi:hypothetical protein
LSEREHDEPNRPEIRGWSRRLQFKISTALLLTAAIASWLGYELQRRETQKLQKQLPALRDAARELSITDESRIFVVQKHRLWNNETTWDVFVPQAGMFEVCFATEGIATAELPEPKDRDALEPGKHQLTFTWIAGSDGSGKMILRVDGETRMDHDLPIGWSPSPNRSSKLAISQSTGFAHDQPVLIYHEQILDDAPGPNRKGAMIWIQSVRTSSTSD